MPENLTVLLVDDNQDDRLLVARAFDRAGLSQILKTVPSGGECMAYLKGEPPYADRVRCPMPDLVLLDIKMPRIDGFEVLQWIRTQPEFFKLPVVMLTSSDELRDVNLAYQMGANSFLVKPLDFWNAAELTRSIGKLLGRAFAVPPP